MVVLEVRIKQTGPVASESLTTGLMTVILSTAFHLSFKSETNPFLGKHKRGDC